MRRDQHYYDADPATMNAPFAADEAIALLRAMPKGLVKNRDNVEHLLCRLAATASALRQTRIDFDNELRARSQVLPASGGATLSVNPEQAARFLSPEQLTRLFDKFAQERLAALEAAKTAAEESKDRADAVIAAVAALVNDPSVDPATRQRLADLIERGMAR